MQMPGVPRVLLRRMFDAAIASAQPALCVAPHLPAPMTTSRPRGASGRCGGTHSAGCAEATAASNMRRSSARGSAG